MFVLCEFFQTPPPTALEIPTPTPTARATTTKAIKTLIQILVFRSKPAMQPQMPALSLCCFIAFFFLFICCWPGHTVHSCVAPVFAFVNNVPLFVVCCGVRQASTSVSYIAILCFDEDFCASSEYLVGFGL